MALGLNHISELHNYIKQLGEDDVFINVITKGITFDQDKATLYPELNIRIDNGNFTNGQSIVLNVILSCVDIRDENKEVNTDKFFKQDNELDNLNETFASLNRLWTIMFRDFTEKGFTASENPPFEAIIADKEQILDGWELIFSVEMPNEILNLCSS